MLHCNFHVSVLSYLEGAHIICARYLYIKGEIYSTFDEEHVMKTASKWWEEEISGLHCYNSVLTISFAHAAFTLRVYHWRRTCLRWAWWVFHPIDCKINYYQLIKAKEVAYSLPIWDKSIAWIPIFLGSISRQYGDRWSYWFINKWGQCRTFNYRVATFQPR